jgi:hypothetical protein
VLEASASSEVLEASAPSEVLEASAFCEVLEASTFFELLEASTFYELLEAFAFYETRFGQVVLNAVHEPAGQHDAGVVTRNRCDHSAGRREPDPSCKDTPGK